MSLEEIFAQAILTGGVTILNCSVVIGSNAQVSDFLQNTAASNQNLKVDQEIKVDPRLKTEKAALIWKTLTEHKYIHTEYLLLGTYLISEYLYNLKIQDFEKMYI